MWSVGNKNKTADVYLCTRGFALCVQASLVTRQVCVDLPATLDALKHELERRSSVQRLRVHLSASLCRPFMHARLTQLQPAELDAALQTLAQRKAGFRGACQVWQSNSASEGGAVAVAVERLLLDQLTALRTPSGRALKVVSVGPAWAEGLRVVLARAPDLVCTVLHDWDAVTVLAGQGDSLSAAASALTVPEDASTRDVVARLLLSTEQDHPPGLQARLHLSGSPMPATDRSALSPILEILA